MDSHATWQAPRNYTGWGGEDRDVGGIAGVLVHECYQVKNQHIAGEKGGMLIYIRMSIIYD